MKHQAISRYVFFAVSVLLVAVFQGCLGGTPRPSDMPKLTPCTITVTQENAPLAGVTVSLSLGGDSQPWLGGGVTGEDGVVELYTNGRYKGVPEGKFKVVLSKTEIEAGKIPPRPAEDDPGFGEWMNKYENAQPDVFSLVEKEYTDPKTTPLEIEISGSKPVTTTFDAGKKVRVKMN